MVHCRTKNNSAAAQEKCITRLILYHLCVNLPVMIASYPVFRFMGMRSSLPLPSWKVISTQILFYFILEDFVFYWGHRTLHTKWLYKHVHNVHHEYATPFGLTSEYAHPAEILFLGFATIVGPAITGPHLLTLWLWMVLRVLETVEAHSGYHFPWSPSNFLPLYGGADFHDYHHRLLYTKSGNYSSTFVYMDRLSDRLMKSPCLVIRLGIQYSWSPKFQDIRHRQGIQKTEGIKEQWRRELRQANIGESG
ncbi:methylsterol monooxygenase 2-2 isoform X4 [Diospyros lotus]|uniref:methylsterol monooxygenase 2-2 isoform X4 n=1 Tax=Diospyros lotus TaxID=55363 RepID=UPI00224D230B|nr:methylsterol monooxygenase 2-2 isoform X4 [Diospyros lotus]